MTSTTNTINLTAILAQAVTQRVPAEATYDRHTFSIWYDQTIPVITVTHPEHGVIFEELASDKQEVMAQLLEAYL